METIEVFDKEYIPFINMTKDYGRAEFLVCPVYKDGFLTELHISPRQQPDAEYDFVIKGEFEQMMISSWVGVGAPRIWMFAWCPVHKTSAFRVYVPKDADRLEVMKLSSLSLNFASLKENTGPVTKSVFERIG